MVKTAAEISVTAANAAALKSFRAKDAPMFPSPAFPCLVDSDVDVKKQNNNTIIK
jgi:hypothetical protein